MINPWLDSIILWIHILAAISWVGGMIFVAFIVAPYVRRAFPPAERTPLMAEIGKRFSYLGWSAIAVLIATGIYNTVRFLHSWNALLTTNFGHILLAKLSLVGVMILLSIAHDFFLGPRQRNLGKLLRHARASSPLTQPAAPTPVQEATNTTTTTKTAATSTGTAALEQPDRATVEAKLQRLRRWTVLIAQANLVLAIVVILLAASLQSF